MRNHVYTKISYRTSASKSELSKTWEHSTFFKEFRTTEELWTRQPKEESGSSWAAFPKDTHTAEDLVTSSSLDEAVMLSAG